MKPDRPQWINEVAAITGVVFVLAFLTNLLVVVLAPRSYAAFADWAGAPGWVRDLWAVTVGAHPAFWMPLVAAYQLAVGVCALTARRRVLGVSGAALFHCGLLLLGMWPYALPVLAILLVTLWHAMRPLSDKEKKP
ncbi:hypothetical protein [Allokutzneria albata]|uniref:DoxX-like family protein n=1 Tax=Allokutzneria albata TaxID=211114 RepID=A0A1G9SK03_ALLAB|nr:hypothetical protein [Allokutzneria albata]SDM35749.1 hypothetical protein SAMN04489726_1228 [Allokutzneria albata]